MATYDLTQGIPGSIAVGDVLNIPYSGQPVSMTLPEGRYRFEAWGAQGTSPQTSRVQDQSKIGPGGKGGYSVGVLSIYRNTRIYARIGGVNGYNGGGTFAANPASAISAPGYGGGGTDIRIGTDDLNHRLIVAGGGGAGGSGRDGITGIAYEKKGGVGGGQTGGAGEIASSSSFTEVSGGGGTQTAGGAWSGRGSYGGSGSFGNGGEGGGGGGWFGGGGGSLRGGITGYPWANIWAAGGGSGFVLTAGASVPSGYELGSDYYLESASTSRGSAVIPLPDGSTGVGKPGDGYARITMLAPVLQTPVITSVTEPTQGTLRIAFGAVNHATSYLVYNEAGTLLKTISASPYTESGIQAGTSYVRQIIASASGYENSAPATVTYLSEPKLATPTNLKAAYTAARTTLSWNAVSGATSYTVSRNGTAVASVTSPGYADNQAGAGTGFTYTVVAKATGRWDSDPASITTSNRPQLPNVTNLSASQTVDSVTLSWTAAANATGYDVYRDGVKLGNTAETTYTDAGAETGNTYQYIVYATAAGYYTSSGTTVTVAVKPQIETPTLLEAGQTENSVTLNWRVRDYGAPVTYTLRRDGELLYQGYGTSYTDTGLSAGQTCTYTLVAAIPGSGYYDSEPAVLPVLVGRDYTPQERQIDYLSSLRRPFTKLCRLRFLNPNGTTAFALDNNPKNRRSTAFIASGSVSANLQNGQRFSASVTLDNADLSFETAVNKIWFEQEVALDEGLVLSNGTEYYRQTGVFLIDNPQEKIDPKTRTVTYHLVDKWANLDGTLGGNLEGTYEVEAGTNVFLPISALLSEDRGNGRPVDNVTPVYTEYYNGKTQALPDGSIVVMTDSPYTLTVNGDGGTVAQVLLELAGMLNAWIGYDHTGRLRLDPSQDDILDTQKPVLWRFTPEETQLLGLAYTVKKEDVYNDYIIVGEQLDNYYQPGARAVNNDPRSDTCVGMIGRKTKRESASGYATTTQCADLAEWKLKRSSVLQKAVSVSCSQILHIDLNSLVEIVRTDKPGNPIERHVIQGFTRPLAFSGAMTITAVSTADFPNATVTTWPPEVK